MALRSRYFTIYQNPQDSSIQQRQRINNINAGSDTQQSKIIKATRAFQNIPQVPGLQVNFPTTSNNISIPELRGYCNRVEKDIPFTPAPIVFNTQFDKAKWRTVKKFSNKYELIWILITVPDHPATKPFAELYQAEKQSNVNKNLQNMLAPEDCSRVEIFTKEGLAVKIMADYRSYSSYLKNYIRRLDEDNKVIQIFIEKDQNSKTGVFPKKKIKSIQNLSTFIEEQVRLDVENCRKDKPYYNFIHNNSGPELFNRRSIIKNCLSHKLKDEYLKDHVGFVEMMKRAIREDRDKRDSQITKRSTKLNLNSENELRESGLKYERQLKKIQYFQSTFASKLHEHYPLQQKNDEVKKQIYDWVITQYCIESAVYPTVNNTIRFATNNQSSKPISTYVKYLYDALRFYFTTKFRQINYTTLYRGARISLAEQRSFIENRCIWNLGFMSTSRSEKIADQFLLNYKNRGYQKQELVKIVISLPKEVNELEYLWNQEGFFSLDKIPEIQRHINVREQQVLFNPLNVFKIVKWDNERKVLVLKYSPHLQILEKERNKQNITDDDRLLLRNIMRLKDGGYDKGQQLLEEGDPSQAVKYYETSHQTGSVLSFTQKSYYIKGLMEVGSLQKMQSLLKESLMEQQQAKKQLEVNVSRYSFEKIVDSVQSITICEATTNYIIGDRTAEITASQSSKRAEDAPTQKMLLLEVKSYIELAKMKFAISQTLDSIKESVKSLKIIDNLAHLNFCFRIRDICNDLRNLGKFRRDIKTQNLDMILRDQKFANLNNSVQKRAVLNNIAQIRQWKLVQQQFDENISRQSLSNSIKKAHKEAEQTLNRYFNQRDRRSEIQKFEQTFIKAYWEVELARVDREGISEKQQIEKREKLKICQQKMFEIKNDYKELFESQVEAYQVLYRNLYKTSIDVSSCLKSYHKNVFTRYEDFVVLQSEAEGESLDLAEVLWKHSQILYEYGQIIERREDKEQNKTYKTDAQRKAQVKMLNAERIIDSIEKRKGRITQNNKLHYTFQKNEIRRAMSRYFKSRVLDREKSRRASVVTDGNISAKYDLLKQTQYSEKSILFTSLISTINESRELCESDSSINKPLYRVKNACDKIQVLNESQRVIVQGETYSDRLLSCRTEFEDVMMTIQKYKEKQIMERNINMAHLYLLMGENQFRLGVIAKSRKFIQQAQLCLEKSLKLDENQIEDTKINREKLLLGNQTYVGCLRIKASIAAYFGSLQQKKRVLQLLRQKKDIMFAKMSEPLNQADVNQSIGLILNNILIMHKQVSCTFKEVEKPYKDAIAIRQVVLGPYNKYNALDYTLLANLISQNKIRQQNNNELKKCYEKALQIYGRINLQSDSTMILYKMQLKSTNSIFNFRSQQACQIIIAHMQQFEKCESKQLSLEAGKQLWRCSSYLADQQKYQTEGLKWLKFTCQYLVRLQNLVNSINDEHDSQNRKQHISKLKLEVLTKIMKLQYVLSNQQLFIKQKKKWPAEAQ